MHSKYLNINRPGIFFMFTALILLQPLFDSSQGVYAQVQGVPKIASSIPKPGNKKLSARFHATERTVQYIGAFADTIGFANQTPAGIQNYTATAGVQMRGEGEPDNADSGLVVIVDTNQVVGTTEPNAGARTSARTAAATTYDALPVIIKNTTNKNLVVGAGTTIPVTLEALDRGNNWRTAETTVLGNSTGDDKIILKPGDIVAVTVPVYSGSFKTLMRVRVFDNYSEPFTCYLNHSQLTEPVK